MEGLMMPMFHTIVVLVEVVIVLLLLDAIMSTLGGMLGFSWKKILMSAAAVFGFLWLRDFLKNKKQKAKEEIIEDLTEEDYETIEN